ncbi:MAG: type II and III secretion system protein [Fimbriimonadales bacterium]|nr:type II and III secretion system protein [Fimbriimonadales bacterium]
MRKVALFLFLALVVFARPQSRPFCNVTSIDVQQLSNGVQILIKADGVLELGPETETGGMQGRLRIDLENAKSKINRNFIDVSKFPVSYIQLSVPQGAREGVGLRIVVAMFEPSMTSVERSNDQQSVIVTVNSSRTLTGRAAGEQAAAATETQQLLSVQFEEGLLTIDAVKANLRSLLATIARKAEINLIADDSVQSREVSVSLRDMPVEEALRALAAATGLAMRKQDDRYLLADGVPVDLATYSLSETESFRMKSIRAQTASGLLPTFLYSYLHVNEAQNAVVVTAPRPMLEKIRGDFERIDVAPPQIMIEALAVEVSSTDDLLAELSGSYTDGGTTASGRPRDGQIRFDTIGTSPADLQARLTALVAQGRAKVHAAPRMAAINGRNADIFIGETKFIKVEVNSFGGKQERIQGVDVGVKLSVRPWTGGNGEVTVTLVPEVSNISELDRETGLPVLSTRRAETTVRVRDGQTIAIGGLNQTQEYTTDTKVPLLGDLPLIGPLFQTKKKSRIDTELVVFVTPHILDERGRLRDQSREREIRERFGVGASQKMDHGVASPAKEKER